MSFGKQATYHFESKVQANSEQVLLCGTTIWTRGFWPVVRKKNRSKMIRKPAREPKTVPLTRIKKKGNTQRVRLREGERYGSVTKYLGTGYGGVEWRSFFLFFFFSLQRIVERSKGRFELIRVERVVLVRLSTSLPIQPVFHTKKRSQDDPCEKKKKRNSSKVSFAFLSGGKKKVNGCERYLPNWRLNDLPAPSNNHIMILPSGKSTLK